MNIHCSLLAFLAISACSTPRPSEPGQAPTIVVLGKTAGRMREVMALIDQTGRFQKHAHYTEASATAAIRRLPEVDILLLGGAVEEPVRMRLRRLLKTLHPAARISEPGVAYDYSDRNIARDLVGEN
jgi:hypothetical protein